MRQSLFSAALLGFAWWSALSGAIAQPPESIPGGALPDVPLLDAPNVLSEPAFPTPTGADPYIDLELGGQDFSPPPHSGCGCAHCRAGGHGAAGGYGGPEDSGSGVCLPATISEGWCRRPWYADAFVGAITGGELQNNLISQRTSVFGGVRLGRDLDTVWGVEGRLGFVDLDLKNLQGPPLNRSGTLILADINLVHYFGQHPTVRPFFSVGAGLGRWSFQNAIDQPFVDTHPAVPISIGFKQRYDDWLVFRFDLADNMVFGGGTLVGTQHEVSVTGAVELRFGGSRTSYWPWRRRTMFW